MLVSYRRLSPLFQFSLPGVTLVYLSQWDELKAYALSLLILFEYKDIVLVRTVVDFLQ
jgi:hypothetical protein